MSTRSVGKKENIISFTLRYFTPCHPVFQRRDESGILMRQFITVRLCYYAILIEIFKDLPHERANVKSKDMLNM